jgi:hypothetical protein
MTSECTTKALSATLSEVRYRNGWELSPTEDRLCPEAP